jgi:tRNA dimethylallyltransferase
VKNQAQDKKVIVVCGPTGVGKTDIAIRLALEFGTEVISADARQIYRELEIGTAKPTPAQLAAVPHHFVNSHSIHDDFNAAIFGEQALKVVYQLFETHHRVIVCGGSGLYIRALLEGFDEVAEIPKGVREDVISEYESKGIEWLQEEVKKNDPDYFAIVDQKNPHRLMRAVEIFRGTRIKMGEWRKSSKRDNDFSVVKIGLTLPMQELNERIDKRMDQMISDGLFEEVAGLYQYRNLQALQTVGYREIFADMDKAYDHEEAIRLLKRNSRHYAKRQMTWFRKDNEVHWLRPDQWDEILNLASR